MSSYRVCFVGLKCYDLISGADTPTYLGGAEKQQYYLARELVQRGHDVSFVTYDHGQPDGEQFGGITIYKCYRLEAGWPLIRFLHPRWTSFVAALKRADADVYQQMSAGWETGQAAIFVQRLRTRFPGRRRLFVYAVASDSDCDPELPALKLKRERILYRYGIRRADLVIAQTRRQQERLGAGMGLKSVILPMIGQDPGLKEYKCLQRTDRSLTNVLWIGRTIQVKRLEWLLEVARRRPLLTFDVVGTTNMDATYAVNMTQQAADTPNVVMHGKVSHEKLDALYRRAAVLCCTSSLEGFPNTFLEAWSRGLPVVTTFDPDDTVARHKIGASVYDIEGLVSALDSILSDSTQRLEMSRNARRYFERNHLAEMVTNEFERVVHERLEVRNTDGPAADSRACS